MTKDKSRIQSCIDHINTAVDVDPWAKELVAEMGKEILKAQLSGEGTTSDTTSDCISRQAAIDAIERNSCNTQRSIEAVQALPSVQPVDKDINVSCKDAISRQAAIDEAEEWIEIAYCERGGQRERDAIRHVIKGIKKLPSVQPEPCEDAVSRNAIIQKLNTMDRYVSEELILCDTDKKFPKNEVFIVDDVYEEIVENLTSAQPETAKRIVGKSRDGMTLWYQCDMCNEPVDAQDNFCRGCGRRLTDG